MIRLVLGNVGSGKTASTVRWMKTHNDRTIVTNIAVKGKDFKHVIKLKPEMILLKEPKGQKKNGEVVYDLKLNTQFWKDLVKDKKKLHVVIDEAHTFFNPRRSMSKINIIMTDFLALLRRVLGSNDSTGELVLITQLSRRLDVIAKEMATKTQYCVYHFIEQCNNCGVKWQDNNENPDKRYNCPKCNSHRIQRIQSVIEIWDFRNVDDFNRFHDYNEKTYYNHYLIRDITTIFGNYDTLQWDDLLSNY